MTARGNEMAQDIKTLEILEHTGPKERTESCTVSSDATCATTCAHSQTWWINKYNTIKNKTMTATEVHTSVCAPGRGQEDLDPMRIYLNPSPFHRVARKLLGVMQDTLWPSRKGKPCQELLGNAVLAEEAGNDRGTL